MVAEPDDLLGIGAVARRSGLAASALRHYERRGLIRSTRSPGGKRFYPRPVLRRIAFVRAAQHVGFTLDEIRAELDGLPGGAAPTSDDWERLSRRWRSRLDERIEEMEALRDRLTSCIGCGCLSLDRCALANPGDRAAGRGARHLPPGLR